MDQAALKKLPRGWKSIPSDLGSDQTAFKGDDVDFLIK